MDRADPPQDPGHLPYDGHARKICCTMGTPFEWRAMDLPSFQSSTPWETYIAREGTLQTIIGNAILLDDPCQSGGERCLSSPSPQNGGDDGHAKDECRPNTGDIRTGHYTNNIGDSAYFETLGGGRYRISLWDGTANQPQPRDWYNSGEGTRQGGERIHSIQPAVAGHPFQEYEFEGYWEILCPWKVKLVRHRNYLKGERPNNSVGWENSGYIYTLVN